MLRMTESEIMTRFKEHVKNKPYTLVISKDGEPCEIAGKTVEDIVNVDGALMAVTDIGLYQLIPDEEMTMMYIRNEPTFVEVSEYTIVNIANITNVENESRRIWMGEQSVCGDETHWPDFMNKYDLFQQGKLSS